MTIKYQPSVSPPGAGISIFNVLPASRWLALLLCLGLMLLWSCGAEPAKDVSNADEEQLQQSAQAFARLAPNRPFTFNEDLEGETFTIENPAESTAWTTRSGTVLTIPANAIVTADGSLATGPVNIHYREFRDVAEIISSGIPMTVRQKDGEDQWMQTAGMFEIRGDQMGKQVQLAEDKSIQVDYLSPVDGAYDDWVLDEETNNWINLGPAAAPEEVAIGGEQAAQLAQEIAELKEKTTEAPEKPVYEKQNEIKIEDPVNLNQFPELRDQTSHVFVYAGTDQEKAPKNNSWIRTKDWSRYELSPTGQTGLYELTLLAEDVTFSMLVKKAMQEKDIEAAKARYQALMAEYQANLVTLRDREMLLSQQRAFRRSIQAQGFGIHNYDILWKNRNSVRLLADFSIENMPNSLKDALTIYFVTQNNQVVVGLPRNNWSAFRFDPKLDNKLLAVLPDNKVALFTQSDFKAKEKELVAANGKAYAFEMKVQEKPMAKLNDLREVISMASL